MAFEGLIVTVLSIGILLLYVAWIFFGGKKVLLKKNRIIGLTGGIGSGKSTVAALFREEGIPVIDMDRLGREIIETNKTVQQKMVALFGSDIKTEEGIDRKKVREIVFHHPMKRKELEAVLHPLIWEAFHRQAKELFERGNSIVLCEAALLIENKRLDRLDGLIVVMADEKTRKQRLLERDKINHELAEKMLSAQVSDEERIQKATFVIENQTSFNDLKQKVKDLVRSLN